VQAAVQSLGPAHHHPHDWFGFDRRRWMTAAADRLWGTAGVGPDDVDAAMLYDHFTPMVLLALEDWGFCGEGEGGAFAAHGAICGPDGRLPVNTHGGQLSEAFIHGFNNWNEAVRQLRGTSTCQVPDAELVFVAAASSDPYGGVLLARS
jgi:acetyl-CoA acetyltransferase